MSGAHGVRRRLAQSLPALLTAFERLLAWNGRERGARWLKLGSGVALILGGLYFLWTSR